MSTLSELERVVFFPSAAGLDDLTRAHGIGDSAAADPSGLADSTEGPHSTGWAVPIRARVFDSKEQSLRRRVGLLLLRKALGLSREEARTEVFLRRARSFLAEDRGGVGLSLRLGSGHVRLAPSGPDGHVSDLVRLPGQVVGDVGEPIELECIERPAVACPIWLIPAEGVSVVTDIDDTIKVSCVARRRELLRNTFLRDYRSVPGMAELYREWAEHGATFHYVSNTPWQLYDPLAGLLRRDGFPGGEFRLRRFRWRDSTFVEFFRSPEQHKLRVLRQLFHAFPRRRFVLVGDTGERDPEVYARCARERGAQVARVLLRRVDGTPFDAARAERCFGGTPSDLWRVFDRPDEISEAISSV